MDMQQQNYDYDDTENVTSEKTAENTQESPTQEKSQNTHQDSSTQEVPDVSMCLAELSIWQDQCKRISAEFENFKRRVEKDKIRWAEVAKESMLLELLSFVDTFEMALQQKSGADFTGIEMVYQALIKLLSKQDVVAMQSTVHFDPQFHEAVMQVSSEKHQSGEIVDVLSKGFMIKDRVLRPAKVSVAV